MCVLFAGAVLTFYVAGLILLHCVLYEYSTDMLLLTRVVRKILHYLHYMSLIFLLTRLSVVLISRIGQSKLPNQSTGVDRVREIIFRVYTNSQSLPSS